MSRQDMLRTIEDAYAARVRGDLDGVMQAFSRDAVMKLNAAPSHSSLAYFTEDEHALQRAMAELIETFAFSDFQIIDSVVEGSKAVVRSSFTVKAKPTGKAAQTEVLDLFEFKDGKIVSMTQFCDTAIAAQLLAQ